MKIRQVTLITAMAMLVGLTIGIFLVSQFVVLDGARQIDIRYGAERYGRVQDALDTRVESLAVTARDWAQRDELSSFISGASEHSPPANLNADTFELLDIQYFAVVNTAGEVIYTGAEGDRSGGLLLFQDSLTSFLFDNVNPGPEPPHAGGISGFYMVSDMPMIVAAQPITANNGEVPTAGMLLFGRYLDTREIAEIADKTLTDFIISPITSGSGESGLQASGDPAFLENGNSEVYAIEGVREDIFGDPAFITRIHIPPEIDQEIEHLVDAFVALSILLFIACIGFVMLMRRSFILKPIDNLNAKISEVHQSGDLSQRIEYSGDNELSDLARCLNATLDSLENSQKELQESKDKLSDLIDLLPQTIFELDAEGEVTYTSRRGYLTFGFTDEDLTRGINAKDLFVPEDQDRLKRNMAQLMRGYVIRGHQYTALRKDGSTFPVITYSTPIYRDGGIVGLRGMLVDISELKDMEMKLRKREEQLNLAMKNANIIVWDWDVQRDYIKFYDKEVIFLGYPLHQMEGPVRAILQLIHEEDREEFIHRIEDHLDGNTPLLEYEFRVFAPHDTIHWIRIMGSASDDRDTRGRPVRMNGILMDITENRQYFMAMTEANKKLNLLSSITRHDILNQVTGIEGFIDLLKNKLPEDEVISHHFGQIIRATKGIQDQMTFTRDYHNVGVNQPEWQRVDTILQSHLIQEMVSPITLNVECGPLEVFADPMLEKIFYNLVDNSVRHGGGVTEIKISFHEEEGTGVFVFEDNGVGVPEPLKKRIFEQGYGSHTGLGLFLTKEILEITGMSIREVGSEGEGARFEIHVPRWGFRIVKTGRRGDKEPTP